MNRVTRTPLERPITLPDPECRTAVEDSMHALIDALVEKGLMRPAVALALADASEDLAIRLARNLPANTNTRSEANWP
jgi:hypothetical protein